MWKFFIYTLDKYRKNRGGLVHSGSEIDNESVILLELIKRQKMKTAGVQVRGMNLV